MVTLDTELFVGGCADGHRAATDPSTNYLRIADARDGTRYDTYLRREFAGDKTSFFIWVEKNMHVDAALAKIFECYQRPKKES